MMTKIYVTLSVAHTAIPRKNIYTTVTGKMSRVTEEEFIADIKQAYNEFYVINVDRIPLPMIANEVNPGSYSKKTMWFGGHVSDRSCTNTQLKDGIIVFFVIVFFIVFGIVSLFLREY